MLFEYVFDDTSFVPNCMVRSHEYICSCGNHWTEMSGSKYNPCQNCGTNDVDDTFHANAIWNHFIITCNTISRRDVTFDHDAGIYSCIYYDPKVERLSHASFHSVVKTYKLTIYREPLQNGKHMQLQVIDTKEVEADIVSQSYKIRFNGKDMRVTQNNLSKGLAYINPKHIPDSIFSHLADQFRPDRFVTSLWAVFKQLYTNPWLEKFYDQSEQANSRFGIYKLICEHFDDLHLDEKKPEKIIGIPKDMYKILAENYPKYQNCGLNYKSLMCLIEYYTAPTVTVILHLIDELYLREQRLSHSLINLLLIKSANWNIPRLFRYLTDELYTYQGIYAYEGVGLLYDYILMEQEMTIDQYERYPRSLKLVHDIAVKNHQMIMNQIKDEAFRKAVQTKEYQSYEDSTDPNYIVIAPKVGQDLVYEGASLSHCVGSYIDRVIEGYDHIFFMRSKNFPDRSLITLNLDFEHKRLLDAKGFGNRYPKEKEFAFIKKWAAKHGISTTQYCSYLD